MKNDMEIAALKTLLLMLIVKLDEAGSLSRKEFAELLRTEADHAEQRAQGPLKDVERHDLALWRQMAKRLTRDEKKPWTPTVIEGGKTDDEQ